MGDALIFILLVYGPVLGLCAVALYWGATTPHRSIARVMNFSALLWAIGMALAIGFAMASHGGCEGNALYGYRHCTLIPAKIANYTLLVILMSITSGLIYAGLLFGISGLLEYRWRPR